MAYQIQFDAKDARQVAKEMGRAAEKHLPEAIEEALTVLAYRARKAERQNVADRIDRATPFARDAMAAATAARVNGKWESRVFVLHAMESIYHRLEEGGQIDRGIGIAYKALENQYGNLGRGAMRRIERLPRTFQATIAGINGIWQRMPNSRKLRLLVAFVGVVTYQPQLGYKIIAQEVGDTFVDEVRRQLEKRLRAARKAA